MGGRPGVHVGSGRVLQGLRADAGPAQQVECVGNTVAAWQQVPGTLLFRQFQRLVWSTGTLCADLAHACVRVWCPGCSCAPGARSAVESMLPGGQELAVAAGYGGAALPLWEAFARHCAASPAVADLVRALPEALQLPFALMTWLAVLPQRAGHRRHGSAALCRLERGLLSCKRTGCNVGSKLREVHCGARICATTCPEAVHVCCVFHCPVRRSLFGPDRAAQVSQCLQHSALPRLCLRHCIASPSAGARCRERTYQRTWRSWPRSTTARRRRWRRRAQRLRPSRAAMGPRQRRRGRGRRAGRGPSQGTLPPCVRWRGCTLRACWPPTPTQGLGPGGRALSLGRLAVRCPLFGKQFGVFIRCARAAPVRHL